MGLFLRGVGLLVMVSIVFGRVLSLVRCLTVRNCVVWGTILLGFRVVLGPCSVSLSAVFSVSCLVLVLLGKVSCTIPVLLGCYPKRESVAGFRLVFYLLQGLSCPPYFFGLDVCFQVVGVGVWVSSVGVFSFRPCGWPSVVLFFCTLGSGLCLRPRRAVRLRIFVL